MSRSDEARDLAAAIYEALTVPRPAPHEEWAKSDKLLADRAIHIRGALRTLAEGDPNATPQSAASAIRAALEYLPVRYDVAEAPGRVARRG